MSLVAELKRRNVIRMAGLYLVGAWLITQVAGTLLPMFEAPAWVARAIVIVLALGFVPTLIFSWIYELTPDGLKRDAEVPRERSMARQTGRRIDFAIIAVLLVALVYFAVDRFVFEPRRIAAARVEAAQPAQRDAQADRSIVVLPFADMSQAKDQEYLSDGLAEELLNLLARVPQLRVISRSSAFSYKGKAIDLGTIGKQLGVAHVLEGSVRKAGNAVRITVQLIDARSDAHIWSETYDRPLDNIFAIQDDIAAAVVSKLKITLLGEAPKTTVTDPVAYTLYLKGVEQDRIGSAEAFDAAIKMYEQALAISPDYAQAWAELGNTYVNQAARGMRNVEEGTRLAREAANHALALNPDYARATADLAWIANAYDRDLVAAVRYTERALALDPGNVQVLFAAGLTARSLGRLDVAITIYHRLVELDPANPAVYGQLGKVLSFSGREAEAVARFRKLIELSPGYAGARHWLSLVLLKDEHERARAEKALALAADEPGPCYRLETFAMAYHALGRNAESDAAMAELTAKCEEPASYNIAYAYAFRGDADQAFAWLEKALQHNDGGLTELISQPMFAPIRDNPRWLPFLRKLGRAPEQLAAIAFNVTLPQ
ncbi:MAG TPA: tetratricopeptide repeat protein [Rhodanobacteraceae bacterium]|nr:tetratricopeptide repeat protein [Rhodanobacteraceae bacterium]